VVVHICCKLLFPMFHLFFRHILQTYITSALSGYCVCFIIVLKCSRKCFKCMFQVFNLS
jgi:hypothetical protein